MLCSLCQIHYWQAFRKVWRFTKVVDIYVNHMQWTFDMNHRRHIIILEMLQLWGFMKVTVVDIYVNLTGRLCVNCSRHLHSL